MKVYESSIIEIPRNFINSDSISMNLQCCICNEIFNNPMRLDCGHTYCYRCLYDWLMKKEECPNCRVKVVDSLISRDLLAFNLIMELNVICNNEEKGCPWKGQLSDLIFHMKSCDTSIKIIEEIEKENKINEIVSSEPTESNFLHVHLIKNPKQPYHPEKRIKPTNDNLPLSKINNNFKYTSLSIENDKQFSL